MALKKNAPHNVVSYPQAVQATVQLFYVDNGLLGVDLIPEAVKSRRELHHLFELAGFILRKWKSNKGDVLVSFPKDFQDPKTRQEISHQDEYTKVLDMQ